MNSKLTGALICGLVIGFAGALVLTRQTETQAQERKKTQKWEYKVVATTFIDPRSNPNSPSYISNADAEKAFDKQYNTLAADGWEYVGPVTARGNGTADIFVLFQRPKQ